MLEINEHDLQEIIMISMFLTGLIFVNSKIGKSPEKRKSK